MIERAEGQHAQRRVVANKSGSDRADRPVASAGNEHSGAVIQRVRAIGGDAHAVRDLDCRIAAGGLERGGHGFLDDRIKTAGTRIQEDDNVGTHGTAAHKFRAATGDVTAGCQTPARSSIQRPIPLTPNPYPLSPIPYPSPRRREHFLEKLGERTGARERARLVEKSQPIERIDIDALRDAVDKLLVGQS